MDIPRHTPQDAQSFRANWSFANSDLANPDRSAYVQAGETLTPLQREAPEGSTWFIVEDMEPSERFPRSNTFPLPTGMVKTMLKAGVLTRVSETQRAEAV